MLLAALFLFTLAIQAPPPESAALVLGRVVDAGTGRAIPGAIVNVNGSALPPAVRGAPPRVMTNASGQFVIRGLRKGALFLNVTREGYLDATLGQRRPMGSTQPLQLEEGERATNVEVRMWRPAVIAGTVVDEAGEAVIGARITGYRRTIVAGRARYQRAIEWYTDDRGQYRLASLVPGDYTVSVVSPVESAPSSAGTLLVYPTLFYPASRTAAQAGVVRLGSGEERTGVDLQIVPMPTVSVSGVVIAPDGPGARTAVRLMPGFADALAEPLPLAETVTDAGGAFSFPSVPSGDYTLSVMRPPDKPAPPDSSSRMTVQAGGIIITTRLPAIPSTTPPPVDPDPTLCAEMPLNVGSRSLADVVVPLQPGPRVTGRVEFVGTTEAPTAEQIQGVRIVLERSDGTPLPQRLSFETGHPDENGRFVTAGVPPGRYLLRVTNTIQGWFFLAALSDGHDLADTPVDLRRDVKDVVLTFTDRPSTLTGIVRDGSNGDGDAYVIAFPVDVDSWVDQGISQRRMRTTRAAKNGAYTLPPLPPGEYYVAAVKDDYSIEPYDPTFLSSLVPYAKQIRLVEGENRSQDLTSVTIK